MWALDEHGITSTLGLLIRMGLSKSNNDLALVLECTGRITWHYLTDLTPVEDE